MCLGELQQCDWVLPVLIMSRGNAGPFTLQGTSCFVIGPPHGLVLLDTGEGLPAFVPLLKSALKELSASHGKVQVSHVVLSHWHGDHVGGLRDSLELLRDFGFASSTGPRVWKFPGVDKDAVVEDVLSILDKAAGERYFAAPGTATSNLHWLTDGQVFPLDQDTSLEVLHTPGHTSDSISLLLRSPAPTAPVLFTADTVLGHGTAVFESLSPYITSLRRYITTLEAENVRVGGESARHNAVRLLCGHGAVVEDGIAKIEEYIQHRLEREEQVVQGLRAASDSATAAEWVHVRPGATLMQYRLMAKVYGDTIPESLWPAATRGVLLHLEKLATDGRAVRAPNGGDRSGDLMEGWSDRWHLSENSNL